MTSNDLFLSFDTSAAHCAAALLCGGQIIASQANEMHKGQAEALGPLVIEMLTSVGKSIEDVTYIGVGIGPGNFTGIRISVSFARGLSLALGCPAIAINSFEASYFGQTGPAIIIVPAARDQIYFKSFPDTNPPRLGNLADAETMDAPLIWRSEAKRLVENIAHLTALRREERIMAPAPLYIKAADAAPSPEKAPIILG